MAQGQANRPLESADGSPLTIQEGEAKTRDVDSRELLVSIDASLKGVLALLRLMAAEQGIDLPEEIEENDA